MLAHSIPINRRLNSKPGVLDSALSNLLASFDAGSLVPVPRGVQPDAVPPPLAAEAHSPGYLRRLATSDIAVSLGGHPGLAAIRFADRPGLGDFLARNVPCQETLITGHADGAIIWVRATMFFRASLDLPQLQVRMGGNLLVYDRDALNSQDVFLNITTIKEVSLAAINWRPDSGEQVAAWLASLDHGAFFRRGGRGQMIPNTRAWRAYLAAELKPSIAYDTQEQQLYQSADRADWRPVTDDAMRDEIRRLVVAAPVGNVEAKARLSDEWLARLCARLKSSLATRLPLTEARLRAFADECLFKEPGANTTNAELTQAFEAHCRQTGQPRLSANRAKVMLGRILRGEPWLVGYSKSIRRPAGDQNGWRGVKLRDRSIPPMTSDGAAGALGAKT